MTSLMWLLTSGRGVDIKASPISDFLGVIFAVLKLYL